jgi:23S rRNA (adenine-N6)-dimethyltransferase
VLARGPEFHPIISPSEMSTVYRDNENHIEYFSQNELINKKILRYLINQSSISRDDLVYDIGAGSGNITGALLEKGARVIAIEKDTALYRRCRQRFLDRESVSVRHADFLLWEFSPGHRYKVFANIPFARTADIVNRLVFNKTPPEDCYLIMQKEAAEKYAGTPKETLSSLLVKPLFWVDIVFHFERSDFHPVPAVDIVLIQLERRKCRLVNERDYSLYKDFIVFCREGGGITKRALKDLFGYARLKRITDLLQIDYRAGPAELNFRQYLGLFQYFIGNEFKDVTLIEGAEARLKWRRAGINKIHRTNKGRKII